MTPEKLFDALGRLQDYHTQSCQYRDVFCLLTHLSGAIGTLANSVLKAEKVYGNYQGHERSETLNDAQSVLFWALQIYLAEGGLISELPRRLDRMLESQQGRDAVSLRCGVGLTARKSEPEIVSDHVATVLNDADTIIDSFEWVWDDRRENNQCWSCGVECGSHGPFEHKPDCKYVIVKNQIAALLHNYKAKTENKTCK